MARILIQADDERTVLLDEREVKPEHLSDDHSAMQLLQRLEWAIKDEGRRLGLPSFKILGASWATYRLLCDRLGHEPAWNDLDELRAALSPRSSGCVMLRMTITEIPRSRKPRTQPILLWQAPRHHRLLYARGRNGARPQRSRSK